jgi:hypothetical protein
MAQTQPISIMSSPIACLRMDSLTGAICIECSRRSLKAPPRSAPPDHSRHLCSSVISGCSTGVHADEEEAALAKRLHIRHMQELVSLGQDDLCVVLDFTKASHSVKYLSVSHKQRGELIGHFFREVGNSHSVRFIEMEY